MIQQNQQRNEGSAMSLCCAQNMLLSPEQPFIPDTALPEFRTIQAAFNTISKTENKVEAFFKEGEAFSKDIFGKIDHNKPLF